MTDQEDHTSTRPISVAELLAKNGNIGAPPVGGRRRRRRGNADSVTVAELTGEIPIITDADTAEEAEVEPDPQPEPVTNGATHVDTVEPAVVEEPAPAAADVSAPDAAEADYEAFLEQRDADEAPVEFAPPPRRPQVSTPPAFSAPAGGAETMSPDPLSGPDVDDGPELDLHSLDFETDPDDDAPNAFDVPSYLRSNSDTLFGGQSVADDLARRGAGPGPEDIDLGEDLRPDGDDVETEERTGSAFLRGVWVVVQCLLAVAFGAGLFIAFDLLWKWNTIVALVLAVLVILGLVAGVRVVRKTEDIASTLIAVAVGALVAFGPLALLQSH
jgi:hypothetical protein